MRFWIETLIVILLFVSESRAAPSPLTSSPNLYEITQQNIHAHINFLASDALEGRLTGTHGEMLAAEYIASQFQRSGLLPAGENGTYFQAFKFTVASHKKQPIHHGRNVLAQLKLGEDSAQIIIVGAHFDHLGHGTAGGSRARDNETGLIHVGADDNASGVASVLEVAAKLADLKAQGKLRGNKNIVFAAWSGEELGILGSSHFAKNFIKISHHQSLHPAIDAVINLDMVGQLRKKLVVQGVGSSVDWQAILAQAKQNHVITLMQKNDPYLPTDSTSFYLRGVPILNLFTGAHDNYHTPRDKPETLNYAGIKNISDFLVDLILSLENKPAMMSYRKVKKTYDPIQGGFRNYLGTIPDYASADISGVKLSGVAKYSPAEAAGVKSDDVIIELAGKPVHDIYEYTVVLNALQAGKPARLVVLRGKHKVVLAIIARGKKSLLSLP